jgi:hypothetical protein
MPIIADGNGISIATKGIICGNHKDRVTKYHILSVQKYKSTGTTAFLSIFGSCANPIDIYPRFHFNLSLSRNPFQWQAFNTL